MFITVMCCEKTAKKLFEHRIEECGREHFGVCVRIIAEQITGFSRTIHLDYQDFPGLNSFSGTFQVLEILQAQLQDFPEGMGTLSNYKQLRDWCYQLVDSWLTIYTDTAQPVT